MSLQYELQTTETEREDPNERFQEFLERTDLQPLGELITPETPIVYWSMEFYDKEANDIKGGGGLGILAADTRRVAEELGVPLVVVTPFYTRESHQELRNFWQEERTEQTDPTRLFGALGQTGISTLVKGELIPTTLSVFGRDLGSTRILTIHEAEFGELYQGGNSDDHRLYQEVALGFGGYRAIKEAGIKPPFMQLNEAPTVFAAIARLDDLLEGSGLPFGQALEEVRSQMLYTNHTLVPAVEGKFNRDQFARYVMPNVTNPDVKTWLWEMFGHEDSLRLSSLAIELAGTKSGVSELHARVSDFSDRYGNRVNFEAVTNGISRKWTQPEILDYYRELGVLDEFDLPTDDYRERLADIDPTKMRELKALGRQHMQAVLAERHDQYGRPIAIPDDAIVYDFKRRFVSYKRPDMIFSDPDRLASILEDQNAHFILTGKPHPSDIGMKEELKYLLELVNSNDTLRDRVHYVQDYDEAVGNALSRGADCAINVPVVGEEACGTSWMKDMSNFKLLISTPDGGVADADPIACLEVSGSDEVNALYERMAEAKDILRNDGRYHDMVVAQLREYIPVISGSRMMAAYLQLFDRLFQDQVGLVAA